MALRKLRDGKVHDVPAPKSLTQNRFNKLKTSTTKQRKVLNRILKDKHVLSAFK